MTLLQELGFCALGRDAHTIGRPPISASHGNARLAFVLPIHRPIHYDLLIAIGQPLTD